MHIRHLKWLFPVFGLLIVYNVNVSASDGMTTLYEAKVKSLDEFIQRMNGYEYNKLIIPDNNDTIAANKYALFNIDLFSEADTRDSIMSSARQMIETIDSAGIKFSMCDTANYIIADCTFSFNNEDRKLNLILKYEEYKPSQWRWCIDDVIGLIENRLLPEKGVCFISPVEHEIYFMEFSSLFDNRSANITNTAMTTRRIDNLSYFFGLIRSGNLKFINCTDVTFVCHQIPGFSFTVNEVHRNKSSNSGWLITSFGHSVYPRRTN